MGWGPSVFPKTREVLGWNWDDHLSGYISNSPSKFSCHCGSAFDTPSGFRRCACGRQWNSYVIGKSGSNKEASADKYLVREIPPRENVIMATRRHDVTSLGGLGRGKRVKERTFRSQPTDWPNRPDRRDKGGKWTKTVGD